MLREVDALPTSPSLQSILVMSTIDAMPKPFRCLVHEYGFVMVQAMIDDGAHDPGNLARDLKVWRQRRQAELLG